MMRVKQSPTRFQKQVYAALRQIPRGRVTTYKILARHIHCRSCRAVGQALRRNPHAPKVPCHRVIASDLTIGGFQGHKAGKAIGRKLRLLQAEGVFFKSGRLADPGLVYRFPFTPSTENPRLFAARPRRRSCVRNRSRPVAARIVRHHPRHGTAMRSNKK
jgi:methylated-DNA-[protein]-cysteine S-methyltransferase